MATTTNFGWETPDDTDLVKDGALAIRTLGSAIDTSLVDLKGGTTGQVLSKTSNTDMDFTWVAQDDSNAIQNAIVDAKGDLITATAADTPARLAVGTNGQVLTADSTTATGLKWAAAGGKILQVVQGTFGGTTSTTSSSYVTTGLNATITPSSTSSKVLILVNLNCAGNSSSDGGKTTIYRGDVSTGTNLASTDDWFQYYFINTSIYYMNQNMSYLDSPSTTSATTYTVAFKRMLGTVEVLGGMNSIVLMEVGA
jgi:hypothetical protein